jgi:uracil-DNA glycosylase
MNTRDAALKRLYGELSECCRCGLCETAARKLPGEGNPDSRLFFIAQAPGEEEEREGRLCVGASGKIFRILLQEAGLRWEEIRFTNLVKCRLPGNRRPKQAEIGACRYFLKQEIRLSSSAVLIPLGFYAARQFLPGLSREQYPDSLARIHLCDDSSYGRPLAVFPLPHPAALLHRPELSSRISEAYAKLSTLKQPCRWQAVCPIGRATERGELPDTWIRTYCFGDWSVCVRYQMEEQGRYHPDTLLPDGTMMTR